MLADHLVERHLAAAFKAYRAHLDARLGAVGASLATFLVLRNVADAGSSASQRDIALGLGIEDATLTRHLDRLSVDGLVCRQRSTVDRRVWSTGLTDVGGARLAAAGEVLDRFEDELEALMSAEELAVLITCLARITDRYAKDSRVADSRVADPSVADR